MGEWRIDRERAAERKHRLRARERVEEPRIKHPSLPGDVLTGRKRPPREEGGMEGVEEGGIGRVKTRW